MSIPITWQNIAAPSYKDAILAGSVAQQSINDGLGKFGDIFKQVRDTDIANWDNAAKNNTEKFYADVASKFKTPEEYQAALKSGLVDQMRQQYGAQIDQTGARKYLEERPTVLMDRLTKEQAYTDAQTDWRQREYINGFKQAIAAASTPEELAILRQGLNTYGSLGHINPVAAASLVDQAVNRGRTLVADDQDAKRLQNELNNGQSTRATNAAQVRQGNARLLLDEKRVQIEEQRAATENLLKPLREKTANAEAATRLTQAQLDYRNDTEKRTPYGKVLDSAGWKTIGSQLNEKYGTGASDNMLPLIQEKVSKGLQIPGLDANGKPTGKVASLKDIPERIVTEAMNMGTGLAITQEAKALNIASNIHRLMQDSDTAMAVAEAARLRAAGYVMPESSGKDPKTVLKEAVKTQPAGPVGSPDQLTRNTIDQAIQPTKTKSGALEFNDKNLKFTQSNGVMMPASLPSGKMTVSATDGDTLSIKGANGKSLNIRLHGVDAQETAKNGKEGQKFAERAKEFLNNALASGNAEIRFATNTTDKGRHIAQVYVNGKNLSEALLENDLATTMLIRTTPEETARLNAAQLKGFAYGNGIYADQGNPRSLAHPSGALFRYTGQTDY